MPYVTNEGRSLPLDRAFSHNDKSFPSNWLTTVSETDRQAEGISWVTPEEPLVVRAPLEREKRDGIARTKDAAGQMLSGSDWMQIAKIERNREVSQEWAEYRAAVIAEADRLEGEYNAAAAYTDIDLIKQNWPENPDEVAAREADEARAAAAKAKREEKKDG
tara:strand:+ start:5693 stop:6178 length:486 start_codon:yes stop_codon:yes gene_type:complete